MDIKFYNTLTRKKEKFNSIDKDLVKMYSCGPTVYSYAHIGNFRAYIMMDTLRRVLKYNGYELKHVMNITDVGHLESDADEGEDKMEKAARKEKKDPYEIAKFYTEVFLKDMDKLNIDKPEIITKATENIEQMIEYVKEILKNGYAYETSKGIYFDISKLDKYPVLSTRKMDEQIASNSINPRDIKMALAHMITEEYHGKEGADKAQEDFINVVSNKGIPDDIQSVKIDAEKSILDLLVELSFVQSKGEAKRLIQGGGVKIDGEKISDMAFVVKPQMDVVLQAGKRKFAKLV